MDNNSDLAFSQASPPALILPRRLSLHGGLRSNSHSKSRHVFLSSPSSQDPSLEYQGEDNNGGHDFSHYYYYPSTKSSSSLDSNNGSNGNHHHHHESSGVVVSVPTFSFGSSSSTFSSYGGVGGGVGRRHTVSHGSLSSSSAPWAIPPRHALHMPVMKIDPNVWKSEHHQQEIYRLMHEGRAEEVMKRRKIKSVMDTSEEDDDMDPNEMDDVVTDIDLGGFKALENREKEQARLQALHEWTEKLDRQQRQTEAEERFRVRMKSFSSSSSAWPKQLDQQQIQFVSPGSVLHPNLQHPQQQQQMPTQLPAPGQQFGQGGSGRTISISTMTTGPLAHPSAWSASPMAVPNATNTAFTTYR
ncbi:hypothetical protein BGZ83_011313 [Gryganskiella cystojenkinii]|nr:hypothetical protein BGZ83_011313 [Gryganskiella cystojenkinii]